MSIQASDELGEVVRGGGFQREYVADVVVDGQRVLSDVRLGPCQLKSKGNAKIRNQGTATLVYSDELGRSIVPSDLTSWMTPYATFLNISYRVRAGSFDEKVLQGTFKLVGVSDPRETRVRQGDRLITVGSSVGLNLADAFAVTDRERFPAPSSPTDLSSAWAEIGRLTGLPLLRNVDDVEIPRSVAYEESRLDAVLNLGALLGGIPYVNSLNQVTLQPDEWGDPTESLIIGPDGQIVEVQPDALEDSGIYNQVVVRSHDNEQAGILATAEVGAGPLRYGGPFGRVPYFASSPYVTTEEQAQDYADALLPRVSAVPAAPYFIQCVPDPRREVGDVVPFEHRGEILLGRIIERTLADTGPMSLKVLVDRG